MKPTKIFPFLSFIIMVLITSFGMNAQNNKDKVIIINDSLTFVPPVYNSQTRFGKIMAEMVSHKDGIAIGPEAAHTSQLLFIIDDEGNIIDGQLLGYTNGGKDQMYFNQIMNEKVFISPAELNGKPCFSYAILTYRSPSRGSSLIDSEFRPLTNVTSIKK